MYGRLVLEMSSFFYFSTYQVHTHHSGTYVSDLQAESEPPLITVNMPAISIIDRNINWCYDRSWKLRDKRYVCLWWLVWEEWIMKIVHLRLCNNGRNGWVWCGEGGRSWKLRDKRYVCLWWLDWEGCIMIMHDLWIVLVSALRRFRGCSSLRLCNYIRNGWVWCGEGGFWGPKWVLMMGVRIRLTFSRAKRDSRYKTLIVSTLFSTISNIFKIHFCILKFIFASILQASQYFANSEIHTARNI